MDKNKRDYYELLDSLVDDANIAFKSRDRYNTYKVMMTICNISIKIPVYPILIKTLRIAAQIFIYFRDWDSSIFCLEKLRDVCMMSKEYNTIMVAYKQVGMILQHMKDYSRAIMCFKKMLQFAWVCESFEGEINAYELLSLQHFYLGDLERSQHYSVLS